MRLPAIALQTSQLWRRRLSQRWSFHAQQVILCLSARFAACYKLFELQHQEKSCLSVLAVKVTMKTCDTNEATAVLAPLLCFCPTRITWGILSVGAVGCSPRTVCPSLRWLRSVCSGDRPSQGPGCGKKATSWDLL